MTKPGKVHLTLYLFGLAGAALFTFLLVRQGSGDVVSAFRRAGWAIALVTAFHAIPLFLDAVAWWVLFPREARLSLWTLTWMRWIGEAVSTLVPSAAVGGDIVRTRLAATHGVPLRLGGGTVLVDLTLGVFTQLPFTLLGLWLLVEVTGSRSFVGPTLLALVTGTIAVGGFYFVQRLGMFRFIGVLVSRLARSPQWQSLVESGHALDQTIRELYARRSGVIGCCLATIASLILASGEVWIALYALGVEATIAKAIILQSCVSTIRVALFPVPSAIGVQEGGYVFVGNLLGVPGETAFALSLIARVRELAIGIPGVVAWQLYEGRRLLGRREVAAGN
ncbi:MAG TPA: flippase-like domain-containing protein [Chthoniobacterales bacterium]